MVLHAAFVEQYAVDEKIAVVNGPPVDGQCRAGNGKTLAERVEESIGDWPDIAFFGGIEGGAVFKVVLPAMIGFQPLQCAERIGYGRFGLLRAGLERYDRRIHIRKIKFLFRKAGELDRAHSRGHQETGQVRRSGKIIPDAP